MERTSTRSKVAPASLTDQAHHLIKQQIIRCRLSPGQRVSEPQIAALVGMSKTPVREALRRLVQEGWLRSLPKLGYEITPVTLHDVRELFGLRMVLEPSAVRMAAGHVDTAQLRRLDELCRQGYVLGDDESVARFLRANSEFHATVARYSGNRRLSDAIVAVIAECERLFHLGLMVRDRSEEMAHEHLDLVEALAAGDADRATAISIAQISAAEQMVVSALIGSPSIQGVRVAVQAAGI